MQKTVDNILIRPGGNFCEDEDNVFQQVDKAVDNVFIEPGNAAA